MGTQNSPCRFFCLAQYFLRGSLHILICIFLSVDNLTILPQMSDICLSSCYKPQKSNKVLYKLRSIKRVE